MVFDDNLEADASELPADEFTLMKLYLREASLEPLLTLEQEVALAWCIQRGHQAARRLDHGQIGEAADLVHLQQHVRDGYVAYERFIKANMRLVIHIAKWYRTDHLSFMDLVQEGNLGLLQAIAKYDPTHLNPVTGQPHRFSTYATPWIRQMIRRGVGRQTCLVRLPENLHSQLIRLHTLRDQFHKFNHRDPTAAELATGLNMGIRKLEKLLQMTQHPLSLTSPMGSDGENELGELIEDTNALDPVEQAEQRALSDMLASALTKLDPRLQRVVILRYGVPPAERPHKLAEIGVLLNMSRERARQLIVEAMQQLRHIADPELRDYL